MKFSHAVPILYSADVVKSIRYYIDILGFESEWLWGNPSSFGGVSKDSVEIYFCEKGQGWPGTWIAVNVDNVDDYHEIIKAKGAKIRMAPENKEWGMREMLVEDPDGHIIRFGHGISLREKSEEELPPGIHINKRIPTAKEHLYLLSSVGWSTKADDTTDTVRLAAVVFAVVAENKVTAEIAGCALIITDHASFYYVKDVIVHPDWQGKRIGTAMMQELTVWLDNNGADEALVGLYTGEQLAPFYRRFGFKPAYGMTRSIKASQKNE